MTRPPAPPPTPPDGAGLTISQLAAHVGVTVRAIRHYHQRGLLAEPVRDRSGYRRYDAQAVVDLIRIKTLADAGVPLNRVRQLLDGDPAEFASAIAKVDQSLQERIRDLERLRRQLAGLMAGERLVLPANVTDLLDYMRSLGVSERAMTLERDGWTLLMARLPEQWRSGQRIRKPPSPTLTSGSFTWPGIKPTTGTPTTAARSTWPTGQLPGWRNNPRARRRQGPRPKSRPSTPCCQLKQRQRHRPHGAASRSWSRTGSNCPGQAKPSKPPNRRRADSLKRPWPVPGDAG